ncbi:hypothetical protein DYB25_007408 [Aphanomyces astaci]|uniref:Uncharacterized protein n=1 Tax=Aphanomyces astaci TaxID=112090 RepID=A0A397B224_APHAT|nr:hypothetical protein DYB25_007408 [Aphanomyces astaci]
MADAATVVTTTLSSLMAKVQQHLGLSSAFRCRVKWAHAEALGATTKAYLSLGAYGMVVLDITTPEHPHVVAEFLEGQVTLKHFTIERHIVYTACGKSGLRIFTNIDAAIDEIGALVHPRCGAKSVAVQGDIALVTFGRSGVRVLDVANPSSPVELGGFKADSLHDPRFVLLRDGWGYVSFGPGGVRILDVTNASLPCEISSYTHGTFDARHMALHGSFLFVAFSYGGLKVLDVSNPFSPVEVGSHSFPSSAAANCVHVQGQHVYVALGPGGLCVLRFRPLEGFEWLGAYAQEGADITSVHVTSDWLALVCTRQGNLNILDVRRPDHITVVSTFTPDIRRLVCQRSCTTM